MSCVLCANQNIRFHKVNFLQNNNIGIPSLTKTTPSSFSHSPPFPRQFEFTLSHNVTRRENGTSCAFKSESSPDHPMDTHLDRLIASFRTIPCCLCPRMDLLKHYEQAPTFLLQITCSILLRVRCGVFSDIPHCFLRLACGNHTLCCVVINNYTRVGVNQERTIGNSLFHSNSRSRVISLTNL